MDKISTQSTTPRAHWPMDHLYKSRLSIQETWEFVRQFQFRQNERQQVYVENRRVNAVPGRSTTLPGKMFRLCCCWYWAHVCDDDQDEEPYRSLASSQTNKTLLLQSNIINFWHQCLTSPHAKDLTSQLINGTFRPDINLCRIVHYPFPFLDHEYWMLPLRIVVWQTDPPPKLIPSISIEQSSSQEWSFLFFIIASISRGKPG